MRSITLFLTFKLGKQSNKQFYKNNCVISLPNHFSKIENHNYCQ